jgi:stage II sporulation protein D
MMTTEEGMGSYSGFKPLKSAGLWLTVFFLFVFPLRGDGRVTVSPQDIKVGLAQDAASQEFSVQGSYRLVDRQKGEVLDDVLPGQRWEVRFSGAGLEFFKNGRQVARCGSAVGLEQAGGTVSVMGGNGTLKKIGESDRLSVISGDGRQSSLKLTAGVNIVSGSGTKSISGGGDLGLVSLVLSGRSQKYRGDMEFRAQGQGITVINLLPLEEYLYGVLPREMPANWPEEALKAQAVASRTFALTNLGLYSAYGFDVLATQMSQMYGGYDAEHANSTRAVNETCGEIVTNRGKPISTFFHSSSGGYTENAQDVWKETLDYIRGRPDPYDKNDIHYNWVVTYNAAQLTGQLNSKKSLFGPAGTPDCVFSTVEGIDIIENTSSGVRAKKIRVSGKDGGGKPLVVEICNADAVRTALGLKSALFEMKTDRDVSGKLVSVTFNGSGYGHGLGMSQYGACGMADKGYNYQDILKYYYNNCGIGPLSGVE